MALAVAVLSADRKVRAAPGGWRRPCCWVELALDGRVRPVWGVLPAVASGSFGAVGILCLTASVMALP